MAHTALAGDCGSGGDPNGTPAPRPPAPGRSLLIALAFSLLAHVLVLSAASAKREGRAPPPVLAVTLVAAVAASPLPRATLQAAAAPAGPQAARVQERTPAALQPSQKQRAFVPAETLEIFPALLSRPEFGEVGRTLASRRLQSSVWIAADGSVEKAFVKRNEISDEVAGRLEQALATVRFTPGLQGGQPVPALLQARLCFDDAGALDTAPPECMRPGGDATDDQAAAPRR